MKVAKKGKSSIMLFPQPNLSNKARMGAITHSVRVKRNSEKGEPSRPGIQDIIARISIINCRISRKILTVDSKRAKTRFIML